MEVLNFEENLELLLFLSYWLNGDNWNQEKFLEGDIKGS